MTSEIYPKHLGKNAALYSLFPEDSVNQIYMVISAVNPALNGEKMKPRSLSAVEKIPFRHDHIFPTFGVEISSPVTSINWPLVFDVGMQLIGPYEYSRPWCV